MHRIKIQEINQTTGLSALVGKSAPSAISTTCPHCARTPVPFIVTWTLLKRYTDNATVNTHIVGQSTCGFCKKLVFFIHVFARTEEILNVSEGTYILPEPSFGHSFSDPIQNLSPGFVLIYQQAARAEDQGLIEVAGPGYRKALEFLVKDYLISRADETEQELIKRLALGSCINDKVDDEDIKTAAHAAKLVGNSETHYVRDEDTSVEELKEFITAVVYWVDKKLMTAQLIEKQKKKAEARKQK